MPLEVKYGSERAMHESKVYKQILAAHIVNKVYEKYCKILPNVETQYEGDVQQTGDSVIIRFKGNFLTQTVIVGSTAVLKIPFEQINNKSKMEMIELADNISNDIALRLAQEKEKDIFVFQCIPDRNESEKDYYVLVWTTAKKKTYTIFWGKEC